MQFVLQIECRLSYVCAQHSVFIASFFDLYFFLFFSVMMDGRQRKVSQNS